MEIITWTTHYPGLSNLISIERIKKEISERIPKKKKERAFSLLKECLDSSAIYSFQKRVKRILRISKAVTKGG